MCLVNALQGLGDKEVIWEIHVREVVVDAGDIGKRHIGFVFLGDLAGSRVQFARRNLVAFSSVRAGGRNGVERSRRRILEADSGTCTVSRIVSPKCREIAGPHGRRHHSRGAWGLGFLIQLLVGTEEEGLVAAVIELGNDDRAAQRKSPLVKIQRCLFCW